MVKNFSEGLAVVYKEEQGWNYINTQGELEYKGDKWVDYLWNLTRNCIDLCDLNSICVE